MISSSERSLSSFASPCRYHFFSQNKRSTVSFVLLHLLFPSNRPFFVNLLLPTFVVSMRRSLLFLPFFLCFLLSSERRQDILCCFFLSFFVRINVVKTFVLVPSFSFLSNERRKDIRCYHSLFSFLPNDRRRIVRSFFFFF